MLLSHHRPVSVVMFRSGSRLSARVHAPTAADAEDVMKAIRDNVVGDLDPIAAESRTMTGGCGSECRLEVDLAEPLSRRRLGRAGRLVDETMLRLGYKLDRTVTADSGQIVSVYTIRGDGARRRTVHHRRSGGRR